MSTNTTIFKSPEYMSPDVQRQINTAQRRKIKTKKVLKICENHLFN